MARKIDPNLRSKVTEDVLLVFEKKGTWNLSLNEIANELKTSTRYLIYHFKSKEGLFKACHRSVEEKLSSKLAPAFQGAPAAQTFHSSDSKWISDVVHEWLASVEGTLGAYRRLGLIHSLETPGKERVEEAARIVSALRKKLPDLFKVHAEALFLFQLGIETYIFAGGSRKKAAAQLRNFLRNLKPRKKLKA